MYLEILLVPLSTSTSTFTSTFIFRNFCAFSAFNTFSNPAGMDASQIHLWDVSCSISETSQRGLIFKSTIRLRWDLLKTPPQRCLWDLSGPLRDVSELHLRLQFFAFKTESFFGYLLLYLRVFKYFVKLIQKVAQSLV